MLPKLSNSAIASRFRGLLPIVVDVETSGLEPTKHALLELAAVPISMNTKNKYVPLPTVAYQIEPFVGAHFDPSSLEITGIDPFCALRFAIPEQYAMHRFFQCIHQWLSETGCHRAVLVGHNAWFDLAFVQAAIKRSGLKYAPLHSFTSFDTATLAGFFLGETVLAKAMRAAKIFFDINQAHSAVYDAEKTAELFCYLLNRFGTSYSR